MNIIKIDIPSAGYKTAKKKQIHKYNSMGNVIWDDEKFCTEIQNGFKYRPYM